MQASELNARYYQQRADAQVSSSPKVRKSLPKAKAIGTSGIFTKEQIAELKTTTDAVHAAGGRILLQLWHVGRLSHPSMQPHGQLLGWPPSAIKADGQIYTAEGPQP